MKFCIAPVSFWTSIGYDVTFWRKSLDGIKALCHLEYASILANDLELNSNVSIYDSIDPKLSEILNSAEWSGDSSNFNKVEDVSYAQKIKKVEDEILTTQVALAEIMEMQMKGGE